MTSPPLIAPRQRPGDSGVIRLPTPFALALAFSRYFDGLPARPHAQARDPEARAHLQELSDRLTGLRH